MGGDPLYLKFGIKLTALVRNRRLSPYTLFNVPKIIIARVARKRKVSEI